VDQLWTQDAPPQAAWKHFSLLIPNGANGLQPGRRHDGSPWGRSFIIFTFSLYYLGTHVKVATSFNQMEG
jgi:hypothetical protein